VPRQIQRDHRQFGIPGSEPPGQPSEVASGAQEPVEQEDGRRAGAVPTVREDDHPRDHAAASRTASRSRKTRLPRALAPRSFRPTCATPARRGGPGIAHSVLHRSSGTPQRRQGRAARAGGPGGADLEPSALRAPRHALGGTSVVVDRARIRLFDPGRARVARGRPAVRRRHGGTARPHRAPPPSPIGARPDLIPPHPGTYPGCGAEAVDPDGSGARSLA
jgi:hypothetical protein